MRELHQGLALSLPPALARRLGPRLVAVLGIQEIAPVQGGGLPERGDGLVNPTGGRVTSGAGGQVRVLVEVDPDPGIGESQRSPLAAQEVRRPALQPSSILLELWRATHDRA